MPTPSASINKIIIAGGPGNNFANTLAQYNAQIAAELLLVETKTSLIIVKSGVNNYIDAGGLDAWTIWAQISYQSNYIP